MRDHLNNYCNLIYCYNCRCNCYHWNSWYCNRGTDYTDGSGNLDDITISAGATTGTVSFTPTDDAADPVYEENETAVISIDGVSGGSASGGSQSVTITITENGL